MIGEKTHYLSRGKLKEIQGELGSLQQTRFSKINEDAPNPLRFGDVDPEFLAFHEELAIMEKRIAELEEIIKNHEIISAPPKISHNIVYVGATVIVEVDGDKDELIITGSLEADPVRGRISNECPVGMALLGKRQGEKALVDRGGARVEYKIVKIKYEKIS